MLIRSLSPVARPRSAPPARALRHQSRRPRGSVGPRGNGGGASGTGPVA
jgi:hypothetical protein